MATLLGAYAVPVHLMLRMDAAAKLGLSLVFVGAPVFFAAACFAVIFREREEAATAFGWNLLGAVAGGLVEFVSMITGMRALYLLALAAYLGAALLRQRSALPGRTAWERRGGSPPLPLPAAPADQRRAAEPAATSATSVPLR
jgi:hypothetical protein